MLAFHLFSCHSIFSTVLVSLSLTGGEWGASAGGLYHPDLWTHAFTVLHSCCVRPLAGLGGCVHHQLSAPHFTWKTPPTHRCVSDWCRNTFMTHWQSKAVENSHANVNSTFLYSTTLAFVSVNHIWNNIVVLYTGLYRAPGPAAFACDSVGQQGVWKSV